MSRAGNEVVMMLSQEQAKLSIRNVVYSTTRMKIYKQILKAVSESPPGIEVSCGGHLEFLLISPFPMVQFFGTFILGLCTPYVSS